MCGAKRFAVPICLCLVFATQPACNLSLLRKARRVDAISGILEAFRSHQIVALGEGLHGNNQAHAFRLALVRDPRFATVVNDIVVEFGSGRYQAVMDRFIRGGDVPYAELRKAWQDTTNATPIWDTPIYEEFFRAVREVNASLSGDRQLRVLLGEPPIDWDTVRTQDDVGRGIGLRGPHAVELIEREVLSRNRRALVIYGDAHFRRYGKWLGTLDFKYFAGMETDPPTKMQEQYDAVLYLGPVSSVTMSELPAALCTDPEYTKMRLARMALQAGGPTGPAFDEFHRQCAPHVRKPQK